MCRSNQPEASSRRVERVKRVIDLLYTDRPLLPALPDAFNQEAYTRRAGTLGIADHALHGSTRRFLRCPSINHMENIA